MTSTTLPLYQWYKQAFGRSILGYECEELNLYIKKIPALLILQLGCSPHINQLVTSPIVHRFTFSQKIEPSHPKNLTQASYRDLPLASESIDIAILPHLLETEPNSQEILYETWRVLSPEGHIVILGFNPWSLWGISRLLGKQENKLPKPIHSFSIQQINSWLLALEADIVAIKTFCFHWPNYPHIPFNPSTWIEKIGNQLLPQTGGIYLIVAKKRISPISPVKHRWTLEPVLEHKEFAQPTAGRLRRG